VAGRSLADIDRLAPPPALKKKTLHKDKLDEGLEITLEPIQKELADIAVEKEETSFCAVPLCGAKYSITTVAPVVWAYCDVCFRRAICPQHAVLWRDRFVDMHVDGCDILPTWQELTDKEKEWTKKKDDVIAEFAGRRDLEATAYQRELAAKSKKVLLEEAVNLGLITTTSTANKKEIVDQLLRLNRVRDMSLDRLIIDHFGPVHWTTHEGVPGLWKQYHTGFNFVDLSNKEFYKLCWPYRVDSFDSVITWDLLNIVHLQSHRFFQEAKITPHTPVKLIAFTKDAIDEALQSYAE